MLYNAASVVIASARLPGVHCILFSAAVAECTPLLAAASCDRKISLSPLGLNLGLMALKRPSVRQVAWGLESAGVLFLQVKGLLMLYKAHGLFRQYTIPKRLAMVGRLCARWNHTVHTTDLPADTATRLGLLH